MTNFRAARLFCALAILASAAVQAEQAEPAKGVEHFAQADQIKIRIWEKSDGDPAGKPVIVLAHGSASSGQESFDLQVPGQQRANSEAPYSLMDFLAHEGFDVFALDVRGFGRSTHPDEGVTTADAAIDLGTAIDYVERLRGVAKVGLLAWSWGTQYAGLYVSAHGDKVSRYVSFAQMHAGSPDLVRRRLNLETLRAMPYMIIPELSWKTRFVSQTPQAVNDRNVIDAFAQAASVAETVTPTGPQVDMCTKLPLVDPAAISVPVMMIHGQYDDVADTDGLMPFFIALPNAHKKYVIVPGAGHMMQFQQGRGIFQSEVAVFFKE